MCYGMSSMQRGRANETENLITARAVRNKEESVAIAKKLLEFDSEVETDSLR